MKWERVYTVNNYHDGPILGVANYNGAPHIYKAEWNGTTEEYGPFRLAEIDQSVLDLILEDWAIWTRWKAAFDAGQTSLETHPTLPAERKRHEELKELVGDRWEVKDTGSFLKQADFRGLFDGVVEVHWREV